MNSQLQRLEFTERAHLERVLSRSEVLISEDVIRDEECQKVLKELREVSKQYECTVKNLREHLTELGCSSRLEELDAMSGSILHLRFPRTLSMLTEAIARGDASRKVEDTSSENLRHHEEYHAREVESLNTLEQTVANPSARGTSFTDPNNVVSNPSPEPNSRQLPKRNAPSRAALQNQLLIMESKLLVLRELCDKEHAEGRNPQGILSELENIQTEYTEVVYQWMERLEKEGCTHERSEMEKYQEKILNSVRTTIRNCKYRNPLQEYENSQRHEFPNFPGKRRSCPEERLDKKLEFNGTRTPIPEKRFDPCMDLSNKFEGLSIAGSNKRAVVQENEHRSEPPLDKNINTEKLSHLREEERRQFDSLSQELSKAQYTLETEPLNSSFIAQLYQLEEHFLIASFDLQRKYKREECMDEVRDTDERRKALRHRLQELVDSSRTLVNQIEARERSKTRQPYLREPFSNAPYNFHGRDGYGEEPTGHVSYPYAPEYHRTNSGWQRPDARLPGQTIIDEHSGFQRGEEVRHSLRREDNFRNERPQNCGNQHYGPKYHQNHSGLPYISSRPNEFYHSEYGPRGQYIQNSIDPYLRRQLKLELLRGIGEPFDGAPEYFWAWKSRLESQLSEAQTSALETLNVLLSNTVGRPNKMMKDLLTNCYNPIETLSRAWDDLERRFGTSRRVSDCLNSKLERFPKIEDAGKTQEMEDLLSLCRALTSAMSSCPDLEVLNCRKGLKSVWIKMPEKFIIKWQGISGKIERNQQRSPTLEDLIREISYFIEENSDPLFTEVLSKPYSKNHRTLATEHKPIAESKPIEYKGGVNSKGAAAEDSKEDVGNEFCIYHKFKGHTLQQCQTFPRLSTTEKRMFALQNGLCFHCLGPHMVSACKDTTVCKKCGKNHIELMHRDPWNETPPEKAPANTRSSCTIVCGSTAASTTCRSKTVAVEVRLQGSTETVKCYCIIDEQSTASFCDPDLPNMLKLNTTEGSYSLSTLSGCTTQMNGRLVDGLEVRGLGEEKWINLPELYTHPFIPDTKSEVAVSGEVSAHTHLIHLADHFPVQRLDLKVQLLLGVNSGEAMRTEAFGDSYPYAHHTALGWCLVGPVCVDSKIKHQPTAYKALRSSIQQTCPLHQTAKDSLTTSKQNDYIPRDFNPLQESPDDELLGLSTDDREFQAIVEKGICINSEGKIEIPLPLRPGVQLPNNRGPIYYRTKNALQRVSLDAETTSECVIAMQKFLDKGHFEQVTEDSPGADRNYLAIFPVQQPKKRNVRLVFDSASKYKGISLNDALYRGPDVANKLVGVILRFRHHQIAFAGDIESMFHSFSVPVVQRNYLKFFWWADNDPSKQLAVYKANVHVFGNKSSPAVAAHGLRYTTTAPNVQRLKEAKRCILDNIYVDDMLGSARTADAAIKIIRDTKEILGQHKIRFHKIVSSSAPVLKSVSPDDLGVGVDAVDIAKSTLQSALGITWKIVSDSFQLRNLEPQVKFTRRGVLSVNSSIFDPIGMASPISLKGRLLQRKFINSSAKPVNWDEPLPDEFQREWKTWVSQLTDLSKIVLPRCFLQPHGKEISTKELHVFSDASAEAIGHVVYLLVVGNDGTKYVSFVFANTKVAPRSADTIPRLELCAALDATQSARFIVSELKLDISKVCYYTDSQIVLGYLTNREKVFSRYVTARVHRILKMSPVSDWHYVASEINPADVATRPKTVDELRRSCWIEGPEGLRREGLFASADIPEVLPETLETASVLRAQSADGYDIVRRITTSRFSWSFAIRVMSLVLEFINLCRRRTASTECLKENSKNILCRAAQKEMFAEDYFRLEGGKNCSKSSALLSLSPFFDENQVIRVGGRLRNSDLPHEEKHPILLPNNHPVTRCVLQHYHEKAAHQGAHITGGLLRQAGYHVHRSKAELRKLVSSCFICKRLRSKPCSQYMADLPGERLEKTPPFSKSGVDVFGPFLISEGRNTRSNKSTKKIWVLLVTCLYSRAVHLETLSSLDITSLKLALRRFIAVRGDTVKFISDCGTNFVGAENCLADSSRLEKTISEASRDYEWKFLPPRASHFAGVWERKVGSIKRILHITMALLGKSILNREEFSTLIQEAASIVNNTPMSFISALPDDPLPVSPAALLTLKESSVSCENYELTDSDLASYGKRRWRRVQYLAEQFWLRWKRDYLKSLQIRKKWQYPKRNIKVGDVVLVDNQSPRNQWPLGIISEVFPNKDGLVRSASITMPRSSAGTSRCFRRAVKDLVVVVSRDETAGQEF